MRPSSAASGSRRHSSAQNRGAGGRESLGSPDRDDRYLWPSALSGSEALEAAIRWAAEQMRTDGLENVRLEPVKVPHWVRGRESVELVSPFPGELVMLGLGNSVGTPPEGIEAEVLVVRSFEQLEARAAEAMGRVVLFNAAFTGYDESVRTAAGAPPRAAPRWCAICEPAIMLSANLIQHLS